MSIVKGFFEEIKFMWHGGAEGKFFLSVFIIFFSTIPLIIYLEVRDSEQWESFSEEHKCQKVGHIKGRSQSGVGFGATANGGFGTVITTTSEHDKTGWLCDDGVTYWR